ncbi:MAG: hypothetical protein R3E42_04420 [Burkholderiaceae bacterium]
MVDAGDRVVSILSTMASPCVVVLGGLLSDDECELIAAARALACSLTVDQDRWGGAQ